jgi:hypothetical protein
MSGAEPPFGIRLPHELKQLAELGVVIAMKARYRAIGIEIDAKIFRIDDAIAHMETNNLPNAEAPFAANLERHVMTAFEGDRRGRNPWHRDLSAGHEFEAGGIDLAFRDREIDCANVHLLGKPLVNEVHYEGARLADVGRRILDAAIRA